LIYNSSTLRSIIIAQHASYWSCSKAADWLRGTKKPGAATGEGWDEWNAKAETEHPIRYWLAEEGLGKVQDFVTWPRRKLGSIRNYVTNRFVSKTHALTSTLKKGQWHEYEERLLHSMFDSLVDYVEIEVAWHHVAWGDEKDKYKSTHRFWWNEWRCPEAGVDHLNWEASLVCDKNMGVDEDSPNYGKPTNQAENAIEILALYTWWKVGRPARPDPYEASGWSAWSKAREEKRGDTPRRMFRSGRTKEDRAESSRLFKLVGKIEAEYDKEDTDMMIRLVKIRNGMWT
jgi:hypothetical protein